MLSTFVYLLVAGFIIWFIQRQKIFEILFFNDFLKELRKCGICLGFWVCLFLFFVFDIGLIQDYNLYTSIVDALITSIISSYIIFLVKAGWESIYGVTRL